MREINIGKNIKAIRNSLNLTQKQFAEKLNITRSTVNHWENHEALPNLYMLVAIKDTFGISYEEIIDGI